MSRKRQRKGKEWKKIVKIDIPDPETLTPIYYKLEWA